MLYYVYTCCIMCKHVYYAYMMHAENVAGGDRLGVSKM